MTVGHSIYLSIYPSVYLRMYLSILLPISLSVSLCICVTTLTITFGQRCFSASHKGRWEDVMFPSAQWKPHSAAVEATGAL